MVGQDMKLHFILVLVYHLKVSIHIQKLRSHACNQFYFKHLLTIGKTEIEVVDCHLTLLTFIFYLQGK